jgi:hypothetical protein
MIKYLLISLLISTQALAGLPPTTLKSQGGSTVTTFGFQTPLNQATQVSGVNSLIETGNGNALPNPGFEGTTGWTASGGATTAINTTAVGTGVSGYEWDSNSASQTLTGTAITIPSEWYGQNGAVSCAFKVPSGTATHTIGFWDGSTLLHSKTVTSSSTWLRSTDNFPFPTSGTITVRITGIASNEPDLYIDDCYVGLAEKFNVGVVSQIGPWTAYTPTFTGFGTVTVQNFKYRTVPEGIEVEGSFTGGTPTGTEARISLPSVCTSASNYVTLEEAGHAAMEDVSPNVSVLIEPSVTYMTFGLTYASNSGLAKRLGNAILTAGNRLSISRAFFRCVGSSSNTVFAGQNGNYDWTAYTPTFTGFGTPSNVSCYHARDNGDVLIRCAFTTGTVTTTEARVSLPSSLTSSASMGTIELAGWAASARTAAATFFAVSVLAEPSVTYVTFGEQSSTLSPTAKQNADTIFTNSSALKFFARVPIAGWGTNNNAPALVGSVLQPSAGVEGIVRLNGTCSSSATVSSNLSGTTIGNISSGACIITLPAFFASTPVCVDAFNAASLGALETSATTATSATSVTTYARDVTAGLTTFAYAAICMGPR